MKRTLALALFLLTLLFGAAFAAGTKADTQIKNTAQASYVDSSGQTQTAQSNEVVTVVQKVYSLTIAPNSLDANGAPTAAEDEVATFGQTKTGLLQGELFFEYTVTNTSNTKTGETDLINLFGKQGAFDDFNFTVLELYQVAAPGDRPAPGDTTVSSVALGADGEAYIVVKVKIPDETGADNNQVGNLNLEGAFNAAPTVADVNNWSQVVAKTPPNVTLSKTASKTNVVPNDVITYTLSGKNLGGTAAYALSNVVTVDTARTGLLITDVIPSGLTYAGSATGSASVGTAVVLYSVDGGTNWTATQPASGVNALGLLIEGTGQFFSAGATYSLTFNVQVPSNAAAATSYPNAATLRYDANGDDDANDGDETFTTPPVTSTVDATYGVAVGPQGQPSATETGGDTLSTTGVTYTDPNNGKTWTYSFSGSHSAQTDTQTVSSPVYTGDTVAFVNTIKNPGNATDTYTLAVTNAQGYTVTLYESNGLTPLTNSQVSVTAGGAANVVVKVNMPVGGVASTTTLTATSQNGPGNPSDVTLDEIPAPQGGYSVDLATNSDGVRGGQAGDGDATDDDPAGVTANPGTTVVFPLELANTGAQKDSFEMIAPTLPAGWSVVFRIDSNCDGVANGAAETNSGTVNVGETICYAAVVTIPAGASPAAYPLTFAVTSDKDPTRSSDTVSTTVTVSEVTEFSFAPNYDNIENPGQNVTYSGAVTYTHTLTNSGNTDATVTIPAYTSANGWTYAYSVDGGTTYSASISNLTVPAGSSRGLLVRVTVPTPVSPQPFDARVGETETAIITATATYASGATASDSVTDITKVVGGSLSLVKSAVTFDGAQPAPTACGSTVNRVDRNNNTVQGDDANPGDFLCYTIVANNKGNSALQQVVVRDALSGFTDFQSVSAVGTGYATNSAVLYSSNYTSTNPASATWRSSLSSLAAGETVYVAVDTNGDDTITSTDTMPQAATLTVTFVVKVK